MNHDSSTGRPNVQGPPLIGQNSYRVTHVGVPAQQIGGASMPWVVKEDSSTAGIARENYMRELQRLQEMAARQQAVVPAVSVKDEIIESLREDNIRLTKESESQKQRISELEDKLIRALELVQRIAEKNASETTQQSRGESSGDSPTKTEVRPELS